MLTHPTLDLLHELGLSGMASGFKALDANPEARALGHAEWLGLLLDHEATARRQKRFEARARAARLRHPASVEDVDYRSHRGLDRALFLKLATGDWIRTRRNLVITGPCGVGKSWLACALGHKACRDDLSVLYFRVPRLFAVLSLARGDGRYGRLLRQIAKVNLLILDDWGPEPLLPEQARDLLEIVEDRYDAGSTLITSQVPVDRWYEIIGIPNIAECRHRRSAGVSHHGDRATPRPVWSAPARRDDPLRPRSGLPRRRAAGWAPPLDPPGLDRSRARADPRRSCLAAKPRQRPHAAAARAPSVRDSDPLPARGSSRWPTSRFPVRPRLRRPGSGRAFPPRRRGRSPSFSPRCWPACSPTGPPPSRRAVVLTAAIAPDAPPSALHRAKRAFVYVRQSSVTQVKHHQESTQLQYRLVDRAIDLGWPRERIQVIDEDLGLSGAGSAERRGFQKLIAEIGLGHAGLVVSLDASRLARNNRDWHQLLELCSLFGVLLADGERLYDPGAYHDRLLLGLSGIMSEAELHQIRVRLHQGERQKAARGELRLPLPAGLAYDGAGAIVLNPDEEVQARLHLVFAKFRELQSARAVMRYLRAHHLPLPVRPLLGPAPHALVWREADSARVRAILQNPAYAGAYVYGRRRTEAIRRRPGSRPTSTKVALGAWEVCLQAAHPGYIGWEAFMANQTRLSENVNRYDAARPGVPRRGLALLQGIALCGRCGRRMGLRYSGPRGDYPVYGCRVDRDQSAGPLCQEVRAQPVDDLIAHVLLEALAPDQITIAVAALARIEAEAQQLERQWGLRRERARYEAERARRQYDAIEPENRLVARSLERVWEEKLRALEAVEQDHARWQREEPLVLSEADRSALQQLGENLPRVWNAATTSAAERKRMLRFVVREVVLDQKRARGQVWLKIVWQTGAISEHRLQRRVHTYGDYIDLDHLRTRIVALNAAGLMDKAIAAQLNAAGLMAARGCAFTSGNVWLLRQRFGIATVKINGVSANPARWADGSYSIQGAAAVLGVTEQTVFKYLAREDLSGRQSAKGQPWQIALTPERIEVLRARAQRNRRSRRKAS